MANRTKPKKSTTMNQDNTTYSIKIWLFSLGITYAIYINTGENMIPFNGIGEFLLSIIVLVTISMVLTVPGFLMFSYAVKRIYNRVHDEVTGKIYTSLAGLSVIGLHYLFAETVLKKASSYIPFLIFSISMVGLVWILRPTIVSTTKNITNWGYSLRIFLYSLVVSMISYFIEYFKAISTDDLEDFALGKSLFITITILLTVFIPFGFANDYIFKKVSNTFDGKSLSTSVCMVILVIFYFVLNFVISNDTNIEYSTFIIFGLSTLSLIWLIEPNLKK